MKEYSNRAVVDECKRRLQGLLDMEPGVLQPERREIIQRALDALSEV